MVIANFDGRNANVVIDAVEFKALMLLCDKVTALQTKFISESIKFSGFDVSQRDVQGMFVSASAISKRLTDLIAVSNTEDPAPKEEDAVILQ